MQTIDSLKETIEACKRYGQVEMNCNELKEICELALKHLRAINHAERVADHFRDNATAMIPADVKKEKTVYRVKAYFFKGNWYKNDFECAYRETTGIAADEFLNFMGVNDCDVIFESLEVPA